MVIGIENWDGKYKRSSVFVALDDEAEPEHLYCFSESCIKQHKRLCTPT